MESLVNGLSLGTSLNAIQLDDVQTQAGNNVIDNGEKRFSNEKIVGQNMIPSDYPEFAQEHYKGKTAHKGEFNKRPTADMQVGEGFAEETPDLPLGEPITNSMENTGTTEPDENYEDQFKYQGCCEGLDIQDIDYEEEFIINLKRSFDENKELDVLIPLLTNPELNIRTFKKTNRGQFELVRSALKKMLQEGLIRFNQGHIEMPGTAQPLATITRFIDTLGTATLGDNTLTKSGLKKIKQELKELAKEMKRLYDQLKQEGKSDTEIDFRITELITQYTNENTLIEPDQLELVIRGAQLTYQHMTETTQPGQQDTAGIQNTLEAAAGQVETGTTQQDDEENEITNPPSAQEWRDENADLINVLIQTGARAGISIEDVLSNIDNAYRRATAQEDDIVDAISDSDRVRYQAYYNTIILPPQARDPITEPNLQNQDYVLPPPQFVGLEATTAQIAAGITQLQEMGLGFGEAVGEMAKGGYDYAGFVYQAVKDSIKDKFNQSPRDKKRGAKKGVPRKSSAKFKDGTPIDPNSRVGQAYFKIQEYMAKLGAAGSMNWLLSQLTQQQFADFFAYFDLKNKRFTIPLVFGLFYAFDDFIVRGGFVSRLVNDVLQLLSSPNLSAIGLFMCSLFTAQLLGYMNVGTGVGQFAGATTMEQVKNQLSAFLVVAMKMVAVYGVGTFFEWFIRAADKNVVNELGESTVRLFTLSSYAIPIAILLFGAYGGFGALGRDIGRSSNRNRGGLFAGISGLLSSFGQEDL